MITGERPIGGTWY